MTNASGIILEDTAPTLSVVYTCFLFLVVFLSLTTNIAVCVTIFSCPGLKTPLDFYILNLSITDLFSSFIATFTVDNVRLEWSLGSGFCKLTSYFIFTCFSVTILTLSLMFGERYYSIYQSLKHPQKNLFRRCRLTITTAWVLSLLVFIPFIFAFSLEEITTTAGETKEICAETWSSQSKKYYALFVFIMFILAPSGIMAFLFAKIFQKLNEPLSSNSGGSVILHKKRKSESQMLLVLYLLQFSCWTPTIVLNLLHNFDQTGSNYLKIWLFLKLLHFLRAFLHPLVYYFMYPGFRNNLRALFKSCCPSSARSKNNASGNVIKESYVSSNSVPRKTR